MDNATFNEHFRNRTKVFGVQVFLLLDRLPQTTATRIIAFQLGKAASSVGANFRAFCRGRSERERKAKICIVVEEADEAQYWLEILRDCHYDQSPALQDLLVECLEIIKITASIKSKYDSIK